MATGLLLAACEPEATPLPVNLPTLPAATTTAPAPSTLRYAVSPSTLHFLSTEDRRLISASAEIVTFGETGVDYDIVVALGDLPDSTTAPEPLQVSLILNATLAPLDTPEIEQIVRWGVDPQEMAQAFGILAEQAGAAPTLTDEALRGDLANAGYPDGFDLTLAAEITPVAENLAQQFAELGIQVRVVAPGERAHLTLSSSENPTEAIPLLTLPICYRANEGLTVTFTPSGFPIVRR